MARTIVVPFDRATMILVSHQRLDSERCVCGWGKLGASWAEHVAAQLEVG